MKTHAGRIRSRVRQKAARGVSRLGAGRFPPFFARDRQSEKKTHSFFPLVTCLVTRMILIWISG